MEIKLSDWIVEKISKGEVILFLGAGATKGAIGPNGEQALSGDELKVRLSDAFLGGKKKDRPLTEVADYAKNDSSLIEVQKLVGRLFEPLRPATFHSLIPAFRWHAIVTTNYDLVVERAYELSSAPLQRLSKIIRDGDDFFEKISDPSNVPFLKLHGCVSNLSDPTLPLILSSEEYAKHRQNRQLLFKHFQDWAKGYPILFCGHEISDSNLQYILFNLGDASVNRPQYVNVNPGLDDISIRYWSARRISPVKARFEDFLKYLDGTIPKHVRQLAAAIDKSAISFGTRLVKGGSPSTRLIGYTSLELRHVHKGMATEGIDPKDFYRGASAKWGVFQQSLDVRRRITDDILLESFAEEPTKSVRVVLLKGHAGAGKSVTLRRVLWEAVANFDAFGFCLEDGGLLRMDLIEELFRLTDSRITIVIDEVLSFVSELPNLITQAKRRGIRLTLLLGARANEWNIHGSDLQPHVDEEYELRDLSEREIRALLASLEKHNCLGHLSSLTDAQRVDHFKLYADRQLLVALHEATAGKPFEEIVYDEYQSIEPREARALYLDVCTLHRLRVPMRAGLLSRVSGITFHNFEEYFFKPLEHVVRTAYDVSNRDYVYKSRHSLIAEMVYQRALTDPRERAGQVVRIIRHMDVDYQSDQVAFDQLIRGRVLAELFADWNLAYSIFDAAMESGAKKWYVLHQRAIFELNHYSASPRKALETIRLAEIAADRPERTLQHTRALILRRLALESRDEAEIVRYRNEARTLLERQLDSARESHSHHAYAQLLTDELEGKLRDLMVSGEEEASEMAQRAISELVRDIEKAIYVALQKFPGDEHVLTLEARFAKLLENDPRSGRALERAFASSPGRGFVAVRLSRYYANKGNVDKAKDVLEQCLRQNPDSKESHLELARILVRQGEAKNATAIGYHLKRSCNRGDANYDARYWRARHEYLYGDRKEADVEFRALSESKLAPKVINRIEGLVLNEEGEAKEYSGSIKLLYTDYCFISSVELGSDIFAHIYEFPNGIWDQLRVGIPVRFGLAFRMRGPYAVKVRPAVS